MVLLLFVCHSSISLRLNIFVTNLFWRQVRQPMLCKMSTYNSVTVGRGSWSAVSIEVADWHIVVDLLVSGCLFHYVSITISDTHVVQHDTGYHNFHWRLHLQMNNRTICLCRAIARILFLPRQRWTGDRGSELEPTAGSRGTTPGQGIRGRSPLKLKAFQ